MIQNMRSSRAEVHSWEVITRITTTTIGRSWNPWSPTSITSCSSDPLRSDPPCPFFSEEFVRASQESKAAALGLYVFERGGTAATNSMLKGVVFFPVACSDQKNIGLSH